MSADTEDKCLVCLNTGGNKNIFTTYNVYDENEELYVDVIKKCFNIEITKDSGLREMCNDCSMKLQHAYILRHSIIGAVGKLVLAKDEKYLDESILEEAESIPEDVEAKYTIPGSDGGDENYLDVSKSSKAKSYIPVDYLEEIPFDNNYEGDPVLDEPGLDKMSDTENYCMFGSDSNRDFGGERKNLQLGNGRESDGKNDFLNEGAAKTNSLLNLDGRARTDCLLSLEDTAKTDSLLNLEDTAKTDCLLNLDNRAKTDCLLDLDDTTLIPFDMEKEPNHDENEIPYFMDLDNVLAANMHITNEVMKDKGDILNDHDEPYSLSILNENDLNTFLMEESDMKVLNIGGNSFKDIAKDDNDMNPETALNTDGIYIPFVFNHDIDKNVIVNVADVTVKDVDKGNKAKPKATRIVIRKKGKKTDVVENPVNNSLENNNANKTNVNTAVGNLANKESQTKAKKATKRKAKSKDVQEVTGIITQKSDENKTDSSNGNDLLEKEGKGKKTAKKGKKEAGTVKENVPGEDVKPKKRRRKEPAGCPIKAAKKGKKDADTVKENVPGEDVKPKKIRRKEPAGCPIKTVKKGKKDVDTVKENVPGEDVKPKKRRRKEPVGCPIKTAKKGKKDVDTVKENVPGEDVKPKKRRRKEPVDDTSTPLSITPGQTVCTVCNAQFETTTELSAHVQTHRPEFVCTTCGLKFDRKTKCSIHMRTHNGPFYCKFCKQEFANVNTRNTHEWRVHSKPEPFKCAHCGERFKTFLKRLRHLQAVHQDNTQYPCGFCDKKFAYAAYRTKHIEIYHLNKREYKCEKCPAAFARRGGLDAHMASKHGIGDMKYECPLCNRKFFLQTALRWHVSTVHNRYSCNKCGVKFISSAALEQHAKSHDKADLDSHLSLGIDFSTLPLDEYGIMESSYFSEFNELEV